MSKRLIYTLPAGAIATVLVILASEHRLPAVLQWGVAICMTIGLIGLAIEWYTSVQGGWNGFREGWRGDDKPD